MITAEARVAWNEIEQRLRPYVARRVASSADVDDILQDIFVRMHRGLPDLRDEESFGGWVYSIAQNVIMDAGRYGARRPAVPMAHVPDVSEGDSADLGDELRAGLGACVALFVARLPSPYREAVTLTELQGLTQKAAAELLDISLPGMKSRVQRGREKIREMFEECCRVSVDCRGRVLDCEPRSLDQVPADCRGAAMAWTARGPKT
jgi:RNA polymerase sigma-70 factor (ECF subfamily)